MNKKQAYKEYVTWKQRITDMLPDAMGVYVLHCVANDAVYVGASKNISKRVGVHLYGMHTWHQYALGSEYRKYGRTSIVADCLEIVENIESLSDVERDYYWIMKSLEDFGLIVTNTALPGRDRHWKT